MNIDEPVTIPPRRLALFAYGFRPFFLAAGLQAFYGVAVMALLADPGIWPDAGLAPASWHYHELFFGFVAAAIAGFLLTAVPNWTGERGHAGAPLMALSGLWLAGRAAMIPGLGVEPMLAAAIDIAFLPLLGTTIGRSLFRARAYRNYPVLLVLVLLSAANIVFHAERLGYWAEGMDFAKRLALDVVLFLVALIGGRIVPAFTINGLRRFGLNLGLKPLPGIEIAAPASIAILLAVDLLFPDSRAAGWIAGIAALIHGLRLSRWHGHLALKDPLIWVLHLGYGWLVLGLALKCAWLAGDIEIGKNWIHAMTAGAFATMILAVMTRATLGHTGRRLIAPPAAIFAYVLTSVAAMVRVFGPLMTEASTAIALAGILWCAAMAAFLFSYAPMLILRRADGKPG